MERPKDLATMLCDMYNELQSHAAIFKKIQDAVSELYDRVEDLEKKIDK